MNKPQTVRIHNHQTELISAPYPQVSSSSHHYKYCHHRSVNGRIRFGHGLSWTNLALQHPIPEIPCCHLQEEKQLITKLKKKKFWSDNVRQWSNCHRQRVKNITSSLLESIQEVISSHCHLKQEYKDQQRAFMKEKHAIPSVFSGSDKI